MAEAATATNVEQRDCVECGQSFDVAALPEGSGVLARWAGLVARRTCDACVARLDAQEAESAQRSIYRRRLDASMLPPGFRDVDLAALSMDGNVRAFAAARKWATGELRGLYLCGGLGVGKSTLAAAVTSIRLRDCGVRWTLVPALVAKSFGNQRAREEVASVLTGTGGLVLDDLDKVKANDWVAAQLFSAIDSRITAGASLLVTSNLSPGSLANKFGADFGDAIASRLNGYCGADGMHEMRGPDRRLG